MSDQKLRELERKWQETGSVEDEAAYLRERVRVGDLTQERLELAAYCGHEGARKASGRQPSPASFPDWHLGLREFHGSAQKAALMGLLEIGLEATPISPSWVLLLLKQIRSGTRNDPVSCVDEVMCQARDQIPGERRQYLVYRVLRAFAAESGTSEASVSGPVYALAQLEGETAPWLEGQQKARARAQAAISDWALNYQSKLGAICS